MRIFLLIALCLLPLHAHAMAEVVQIVGLALSFYPPTHFIGIAILVAGSVYGAEQQRKAAAQAQEDARSAYNNGLQDRLITRVATDAPYVYVYGRARVGSAIVGMFTSGDKDQYRHLVCVHAAHECDAIEEIYIQGKALGTLDSNGDVTGGDYLSSATPSVAETHTGSSFTLAFVPITSSVQVVLWVSSGGFGGYWARLYPVSIVGAVVTMAQSYTGMSVTYQHGTVTSRVRVQKHLGTPTDTADATLLTEVPTKWASTAVLRGLCYTVVRLDLNQAEFQSGIPTVQVLLRGKKLYDPRDATTSWSQNPALAIYDYLTSEMCGVAASDLPIADYITAANACSPITGCTYTQLYSAVTVTKTAHGLTTGDVREMQILSGLSFGGHYAVTVVDANTFTYTDLIGGLILNYIPGHSTSGNLTIGGQYTLNGTVTSAQQQGQTLEKMAQSMAGFIVATTWSISAGKYVAPIATLNQTDIVGALAVTPGISDATIYNGVRGQYSSADNQYVATDFSPYQNTSYLATDGREIWTNIDFPFTDQKQRVINLCRTFVEDQRNSYTIRASFSNKAWALQIGQRIAFTSPFLGQTTKVYRITDKKYAPDTAIELSLKEDVATIWDYSDAAAADVVPGTNLINPYAIAPLASLTLTSGTAALLKMADGTIVSRINAAWPPATTQAVVSNGLIEIEWQDFSNVAWQKISVSGSDTQAYLSPVTDGDFYTVRARTVNPYLNVKSDWVYSTHQVVGKTELPSDVTGLSAAITTGDSVLLNWTALGDADLAEYEIRIGGTDWASSTYVGKTRSTQLKMLAGAIGTATWSIKAIDTSGLYSLNATSVNLAITIAAMPSVSGGLSGANAYISWNVPASDLAIDAYEIRYGTSWAAGASLGTIKGTRFDIAAVNWVDTRIFWVAAIDVGGNIGNAGSVSIVITAPPAPTSFTQQVIDNNVLLYWTAVQGSLPTLTYEIRRGASWAAAALIGTKSGAFTTIFETASGTYTYWIAAIDSAGNYGTPKSLSAAVSQPPDYILKSNFNTTFSVADIAISNTKSRMVLDVDGSYIIPVDQTETYQAHFTTHSWAAPQDQVTAGFLIYIQPSLTSGYYEETLDYGAILASNKVTITPNVQNISGAPTVTCDISVSTDNTTWTTYSNTLSIYATNFRYVKYRITIATAATTDFARIVGINIKLDSKLTTITGMVSCLSSDSGGTIVYLTQDRTSGGVKQFIDVDAIQISPQYNASYPGAVALYDFTDTPYPLSMKILMYDNAGNRISGSSSYSVRGF
jgi:hypothetical protein